MSSQEEAQKGKAMWKLSRGLVAVGSLIALTLGMSPAKAAPPPALDHTVLCSPEDPSDFTLNIDNPYFPLRPGSRWTYTGEEDGEPLGLQITVLKKTVTMYSGADSIVTRVLEEFEWADEDGDGRFDHNEDIIEDSLNYFAQKDGNVCYFGEDVKIYEDGVFNGDTTGSWRADAGKNAPGIFMPADTQTLPVGTDWFIEDAPKVAKDRATIEGFSDAFEVPAGTFDDAVQIEDCNTIDGDCGTKFYAPGVGLLVDGDLVLIKYAIPGKK